MRKSLSLAATESNPLRLDVQKRGGRRPWIEASNGLSLSVGGGSTDSSGATLRNQFFGDINDYHKFGLLRALVGAGDIKLGVCWMLTERDGTHGDKTGYLHHAHKWQNYDQKLFAKLREWVLLRNDRDVSHIEQWDEDYKLLPSARYFRAMVPPVRSKREAYLDDMLRQFDGLDLIFFDPDNGLEVPSKPYGRKPSRRHLYFREVGSAFERGHSVLVIQFFPRKKRDEYIETRARQLRAQLGVEPFCLCTAHVAYFLAAQERHARLFLSRIESVCRNWSGVIQLATVRRRGINEQKFEA